LPVMPQLDIETFRAPIMIVGSFGQIGLVGYLVVV
jgi:hypothetical protein